MTAILIAAPSSGSGKTTVTLAVLRALARGAGGVRSLKLGPDYIDPGFHAAATGAPALNLDPWAMSRAQQEAVLSGAGPLVIESAMGLFDGAGIKGRASAAQVARDFDLPILLVVDCARQSHSIAALVHGMVTFAPDLRFHGVVLNNVGSPRHEAMLRHALQWQKTPVLAALPRRKDLALPSRHLGLVQAGEHAALDDWLDRAADWIEAACTPGDMLGDWGGVNAHALRIAPPAQRIAVARDAAFSFCYPHLLQAWRSAGAEVAPFSPLADDAVPECDFVYLPGGYPELYAGQLARNQRFMTTLRAAAETTQVYGECGGYMTLGDGLVDAEGTRHAMAGLLRLETSFASPARHLGYRHLTATHGPLHGHWRGHEFHHSTTLRAQGDPLFTAKDADGVDLPAMGLRAGQVSGSYAHIIVPDIP